MIDVQLIGYTADLEHLVLDLDGESDGRYRLVVDADLLATLLEMRTRTLEEGRDWPGDELVDWDDEALAFGAEGLADTEDWDDEEDLVAASGWDEDDDPEPEPAPVNEAAPVDEPAEVDEPLRVEESPPAPAPAPEPADEPAAAAPIEPDPTRPEPKLSPAQIQAMLRAGKSPRTVAKAADTDLAWIERWLPPILEERARMLREARALKLKRPRLGTSRATLGDAVAGALAERDVDEGDVSWETSRRNDGRWRVSVKYRHRKRSRTASWTYDPREGEIEPSSDLAKELGFRGPKRKKAKNAKKGKATKTGKGGKASTSTGDKTTGSEPTPADAN